VRRCYRYYKRKNCIKESCEKSEHAALEGMKEGYSLATLQGIKFGSKEALHRSKEECTEAYSGKVNEGSIVHARKR
jgi:hypothetical protein